MVATAPRPVTEGKGGSGPAFTISKKAAKWGDENGYSNLLIDLADFLVKYRDANKAPDYYDAQTPERLMEIIAVSRRRLDKAMAALQSKS